MSTDKESTPDFRIMRPRNKGTINPCGTWLYLGTVDLFGQAGSLSPSFSGSRTPCIFRWYINLTESNTCWMTRLPGAIAPLSKEWFNSGNALNANAGYIFDTIVNTRDKVNIRLTNQRTPVYVSVSEIPMMW